MAKKKTHTEILDEAVGKAIYDLHASVQDIYPADSVIQTMVMSTYLALTPEQQMQIVETVGADWFIKMSAKIERQLRQLTKPE